MGKRHQSMKILSNRNLPKLTTDGQYTMSGTLGVVLDRHTSGCLQGQTVDNMGWSIILC